MTTMALDTGITSFELLNAEAERVMHYYGLFWTEIVRYRRGQEILYVGASKRPMTAWLVEVDGAQRVKTEPGWPIVPSHNAWLRLPVAGREAPDLPDQA